MNTAVGVRILRTIGLVVLVGAPAVVIAPRPGIIALDRRVVLATLAAMLVIVLAAPVPAGLRVLARSRWAAPVVAVLGGTLGTVVGEVLRYPYGWDARVLAEIADRAHAGVPLSPAEYHYLGTYPNTIPLLGLRRGGIFVAELVGRSSDAVLIAANGVALAVTLWLVHVTVRRCAGGGAGLLAMLLLIVLVAPSPWMAVPYTDLYAMPFVIGAVALAGHAWSHPGWSRWPAWAGAIGCAAAGYVIKTTPVVLIVAGLLVLVVGLLPERSGAPAGTDRTGTGRLRTDRTGTGRRVAVGAVVAAASLAGFLFASAGLTSAARNASGIPMDRVDTSASAPALWWVATGMNVVRTGDRVAWGAYDRTLVDAIDGASRSEMSDYARDFIADQWAARGPLGMADFYANKAVWNWSDATFSAWSEGGDASARPVADTAVSRWLFGLVGAHGESAPLWASIAQGVWVAMLLLIGVGLLRSRFRPDLLLMALTTLGIGAFILVFQGRSRYLLTFVPVLTAVFGAVLPRLPRPRPRPSADRDVRAARRSDQPDPGRLTPVA